MIYTMFVRIVLGFWAVCMLAGCGKRDSESIPFRSEFALDTVCTITLYEWGDHDLYERIFARIHEIESRMSAHIEGNDIDRINQAAGIEAVQVHLDVFEVIERAVHYAQISEGSFDPTVKPLITLWGIGSDQQRVPGQEEIDGVLPLIDWQNILLNREDRTVFLSRPGMALDLGAIAKGYAADEAAAIIRQARIPQAIVYLGGDIVLVGKKNDGTPWRVGVSDPLRDRTISLGTIQTEEKAVLTSGNMERYFIEDGVHYHHLFSPFLGYPADSGLMAVVIIADSALDADALSTAVFILGYEEGKALVESLEGVDAIFVREDKTVRLIGDIDFILSDESYRIVGD